MKKILSLATAYILLVGALASPALSLSVAAEEYTEPVYEESAVYEEPQAGIETTEEGVFDGAAYISSEEEEGVYEVDNEALPEFYTVNLNTVGGTIVSTGDFTEDAFGDYTSTRSVSETVKLPESVEKPGYEFAGWVNDRNGQLQTEAQGYGTLSFTGAFKPIYLTVTYNKSAPKNSVIGGSVPVTRSYIYNPDAEVAPDDYNFAGTELSSTHTFAGWYTKKNGKGKRVTSLFTQAPTKNKKLTLYAYWEPKTYTISYREWGSGESVTVNRNTSSTGTCGRAFSLKGVAPDTKDGRTFKGWYVRTDDGFKKISGISAKNREDVELYAKFDMIYQVVMNDTSVGRATDPRSFATMVSKALPLFEKLIGPRRIPDNRIFAGWSLSADSDLVRYGDGQKIAFNTRPEELNSLVASGMQLNLYTVYVNESERRRVEFVGASGESLGVRDAGLVGTADKNSRAIASVTAPDIEGSTFSHWEDTATGKTITGFTASDYRPVIVLRAVYAADIITVKYNNNSPIAGAKALTKTGKFTWGSDGNFLKNSFKAKGYIFKYWAADAAGEYPIAWPSAGFVDDEAEAYFYSHVVKSDLTAKLYAVWDSFNYTYALDDLESGNFRYITINPASVTQADQIEAVSRKGYEFKGWYKYETNARGKVKVKKGTGEPVQTEEKLVQTETANLALYAKWTVSGTQADEVPEGALSAKDYGAMPDDGKDDREAITNAIAAASELYKEDGVVHTVYIPAGTYKISIRENGRGIDLCGWDMDQSIEIHEFHSDHVRVLMDEDTVLMADNSGVGSGTEMFSLFTLTYANDVTIEGGTIDGNRANTSGKKNGGNCIDTSGATNVTIKNCTIKNAWTDGIYMGSSFAVWNGPGQKLFKGDNIVVENCTITESRRNNISVVGADHVTIKGCKISDAHGKQPMCGIDIEPNAEEVQLVDGNYLKGGTKQYIPCEYITVENTTITPYKGITGDAANYFCFNIIEGTRTVCPDNYLAANHVYVKDCVFNGDCYIGEGRDVVITNTKITGNYKDFHGGATRK